jgi:hypothetical protein
MYPRALGASNCEKNEQALLGNARFERAAFGSGGRLPMRSATLALWARGLRSVERQLPSGLELDPLGLSNAL